MKTSPVLVETRWRVTVQETRTTGASYITQDGIFGHVEFMDLLAHCALTYTSMKTDPEAEYKIFSRDTQCASGDYVTETLTVFYERQTIGD